MIRFLKKNNNKINCWLKIYNSHKMSNNNYNYHSKVQKSKTSYNSKNKKLVKKFLQNN